MARSGKPGRRAVQCVKGIFFTVCLAVGTGTTMLGGLGRRCSRSPSGSVPAAPRTTKEQCKARKWQQATGTWREPFARAGRRGRLGRWTTPTKIWGWMEWWRPEYSSSSSCLVGSTCIDACSAVLLRLLGLGMDGMGLWAILFTRSLPSALISAPTLHFF